MGERIFNRQDQLTKRRALRHEQTKAETLLWSRLRWKQLGPIFRRQYSVGPYVLDFYCPAAKLAIEVDGWSHEGDEAEENDRLRQAQIEYYGIRFVRFTNEKVLSALDAVVEVIVGRL